MAHRSTLAAGVFWAGVICAIPALAEKHEPAPDWAVIAARTATPSYARDAPAVVLYAEYLVTVDEQNHAVERERWAVRILKPQGRKFAQCEASYDVDEKLNYLRSWTIAADEKQFQAMAADFMDRGAYDSPILQMTERIRFAQEPASDPGAVVVCESEERLRPNMSETFWQIQRPIPVVDQALELDLAPGGHSSEAWHKFSPVKPIEVSPNHLRWEIKEMPALDLENQHATPDGEVLAAHVSIQWGDTAISGTENQWRAISRWQEQLLERRADPTPEIAAKAQELTAGAPDFYTRLSRITDFIQKNVRYFAVERGIGGWQPHYAADIYRNRYGDCKDKTTLLIAMLEAVSIHAHSLSVDHRRGFIDPAAPSRFGDHMITAIELPDGENDPRLMARVKAANGKILLIFDPTDEETPVGLIRPQLQGGWGYLTIGADGQVLQMPVLAPESAGLKRMGSFILAVDGALSGDVTETYSGANGSNERQFIKENDEKKTREQIEKRLGTDLPGLTFKRFEFHHAADLDQPLDLDLQLSATNYAHSSGPLLLVRPRVLGSHAQLVPEVMEGKERLYPIELGHPGRWRDSFDIKLPEGYAVDEMPDPVNVDLDFASYHSSVTAKDGLLHYEREYVVRQVEIPAARAADFRKLEGAILFDEKGTAVLKKQ